MVDKAFHSVYNVNSINLQTEYNNMIKLKVTKKAQAIDIFNEQLLARAAGEFPTNKAFRKATLGRIVKEVDVTTAAAASLYNQVKDMAEAQDPELQLGRDPKAEKVKRVQKSKAKAEDKVADAV